MRKERLHSPQALSEWFSGCCRRWPSLLRVATAVAMVGLILAGRLLVIADEPAPPAFEDSDAVNDPSNAAKLAPQKLSATDDEPLTGLHNVVQVTERIYSGAEPVGAEAFSTLAALGVQTIVSVDGARPDVEAARKAGLRYVHIPFGYDTVPAKAGETFARLARDVDGPMYVHCHHGTHRGPVAAALICIAAGKSTPQSARKILDVAGTSRKYAGLWKSVETYKLPEPGQPLPELVELAEVASFAAAMAELDRAFDNLKLCRAAKWSTPTDHPDIVPAQEALLLMEGFREARRTMSAKEPKPFKAWMAEAVELSARFEEVVRRGKNELTEMQFQQLQKACDRCHTRYRN